MNRKGLRIFVFFLSGELRLWRTQRTSTAKNFALKRKKCNNFAHLAFFPFLYYFFE